MGVTENLIILRVFVVIFMVLFFILISCLTFSFFMLKKRKNNSRELKIVKYDYNKKVPAEFNLAGTFG